jgi:hypothetical protein
MGTGFLTADEGTMDADKTRDLTEANQGNEEGHVSEWKPDF